MKDLERWLHTLNPEDNELTSEFLRYLSRKGYLKGVIATFFSIRSLSTGLWWWRATYSWRHIPYPYLSPGEAQDETEHLNEEVEIVELQSYCLQRLATITPGEDNPDKYLSRHYTPREYLAGDVDKEVLSVPAHKDAKAVLSQLKARAKSLPVNLASVDFDRVTSGQESLEGYVGVDIITNEQAISGGFVPELDLPKITSKPE